MAKYEFDTPLARLEEERKNGTSGGGSRGQFRRELMKAIAERGTKRRDGMRRLAERLVSAAITDKQPWAIREIMDRVDGKAIQAIDVEATTRHIDVTAEPLSVEDWTQKYVIEGEVEK